MPWRRGPVDERTTMVGLHLSGWTKADLAEEFGVSWRCVHKWVERFRVEGEDGLDERSRAPKSSPQRKGHEAVEELLALKRRFPRFGPAKLITFLVPEHRMAACTASEILDAHGLVRKRRPRQRRVLVARSPIVVPGPGHTLATDYKGHFRVGSGEYCYPLTMADPASRFVLAIDAFRAIDGAEAKRSYERVFRANGVPSQIIHDGGSPFCAPASIGAISELTKWWVHLGIHPIRIEPGRPQQNGRLERMHRDLKEWTAQPPAPTLARQQKRFDEFRELFNHIRPHESHGQKPPSSFFKPYGRPYPRRLPQIEYADHMVVRRVRHNGEIRWKGQLVYVGGVLAGEHVALRKAEDDWQDMYFGPLLIARWDERKKRLIKVEQVGRRRML